VVRVRARLWGLRRGIEPHEGRWLRGVDVGEVDADEEGDEGEDYQVDVGVRGEEGVIEPLAEMVHSRNRMGV